MRERERESESERVSERERGVLSSLGVLGFFENPRTVVLVQIMN